MTGNRDIPGVNGGQNESNLYSARNR